jgi:hypothetical protein
VVGGFEGDGGGRLVGDGGAVDLDAEALDADVLFEVGVEECAVGEPGWAAGDVDLVQYLRVECPESVCTLGIQGLEGERPFGRIGP